MKIFFAERYKVLYFDIIREKRIYEIHILELYWANSSNNFFATNKVSSKKFNCEILIIHSALGIARTCARSEIPVRLSDGNKADR